MLEDSQVDLRGGRDPIVGLPQSPRLTAPMVNGLALGYAGAGGSLVPKPCFPLVNRLMGRPCWEIGPIGPAQASRTQEDPSPHSSYE